MKRIIAVLLLVLFVCSLTACTMGTDGTALNGNTEATQQTQAPDVDIAKYDKDFDGMQEYLKEMKLVSSKDSDKIQMQADVVGAVNGVRYMIDSTHFVEFYEYDADNLSEQASEIIDTISKGETYNVLSLTNVKGAVSQSGKYMMLYPADSTYDYSEIIDEFTKF